MNNIIYLLTHESLPPIKGEIRPFNNDFESYLPRFWNDIPPVFRDNAGNTQLHVDLWINYMEKEWGYKVN